MFTILSFFLLFQCSVINAQSTNNITKRCCSINGKQYDRYDNIKVYGLLQAIGFFFEEKVMVDPDVKAYIMCNNEILDIENKYYSDGKAYNDVFIHFNDLKLEKDKTYKFVIPSRFVHLASNEQVTVDTLAIEFEVPGHFHGDGIKDNVYEAKKLSGFTFGFNVNVNTFDGAKIILSRENCPIMEFDVDGDKCFSDWDWGRAVCEFGRDLYFENNVNYTLMLPEGCMHLWDREDIVNAEVVQKIRGGYGSTLSPIKYSATNIANFNGARCLGNVVVTYTNPIVLAPEARLQLLDDDGEILCEKEAILYHDGESYLLTADFEETSLEDGKKYSICIPEATVVGTGSDITINQRELLPLMGGTSAIEDIRMDYENKDIILYNAAGMRIGSLQKGLNIVRGTDGKTVKIVK